MLHSPGVVDALFFVRPIREVCTFADAAGAAGPTWRAAASAASSIASASSLRRSCAAATDADPLDKADLYARVGLRLTYQPGQRK
jgi:hypothetical protein